MADGAAHDLVDLARQGKITARARGGGLRQVLADLENNTKEKLRLLIRPGTIFQSSGSHQSMAVRQPAHIDLDPEERRHVTVEATCVNADRPVPSSSNVFNGVMRAEREVIQFLEYSHSQDPLVVQVGVWALTDNLTGKECQRRVQGMDEFGRAHGVVTDQHIRTAADLLNKLGIKHGLEVK